MRVPVAERLANCGFRRAGKDRQRVSSPTSGQHSQLPMWRRRHQHADRCASPGRQMFALDSAYRKLRAADRVHSAGFRRLPCGGARFLQHASRARGRVGTDISSCAARPRARGRRCLPRAEPPIREHSKRDQGMRANAQARAYSSAAALRSAMIVGGRAPDRFPRRLRDRSAPTMRHAQASSTVASASVAWTATGRCHRPGCSPL